MRFTAVLAAVLAVLAGCATPATAPPPAPVLAIVGATVLPMTDARTVLRHHTVLVQGGRITAVGPSAQVRAPQGATVIEGRGRWVVPGLSDMHAHLEYVEDPDILKLFVVEGVTTVRSMDGRPFILDWRKGVREGAIVGPRIITAGPIIDGSPPLRDDNLSAATSEAAREAVRAQAQAGYDFIKLYTNLSLEAYRAAAAEAKAAGLPVAAHVPRGMDLAEAARTQWSVEHLGDFDEAVDARGAPAWARRFLAGMLDPPRMGGLAAEVARTGVWIVPTLVERDRSLAQAATVERWTADPATAALPPQFLQIWMGQLARATGRMDADDWRLVESARANRIAVLRALHAAGVNLALGTDTPNAFVVPGASVHEELRLLVEAGLTPGEALYAATGAAARMLGDRFGAAGLVTAGGRADLLLLSADPLADIGAARSRVGLVLNGRWLPEAELQQLRDDLQER